MTQAPQITLKQATLLAASFIEKHPKQFCFMTSIIPHGTCHTPGCALGWIQLFYGQTEANGFPHTICAHRLFGGSWTESGFYAEMDRLTPEYPYMGSVRGWRWKADVCALGLRRFAEKHL